MPPQPLMLPQPRTIIELAARGINGTREASSARHRAARERPAHGIASAVSGLRARCIEWTDIERTVGAASDRARCRARGRGMEHRVGRAQYRANTHSIPLARFRDAVRGPLKTVDGSLDPPGCALDTARGPHDAAPAVHSMPRPTR